MVYAYIRVSTDKQTVENQRFEVQKFATEKGLVIDKWVSEKVSGTKIANDRKLGPLLKRMKKGDTLIITEISRLGRNLMGIMSMLHLCMIKETCVLTVKERYELGNNINSKVLAFAFGLSAEIERDLISQRTKEALAYRKAAGIRLGRKRGIKTRITSLQERNLSLELCSNTVIQRQPYVVSLNVTLKHWMTICGECQKNNVLFEGYIHIYLCIDILCQWKIPNWQHV